VSVVSVWEIITKARKAQLVLPDPVYDWCQIAARRLEAAVLALHMRHLEHYAMLPALHKDPFDRLLIAQSLAEDLPLLTCDEAVRRYPGVTTVW
jgi:PIN domain nuclease of toxin-antitoxin system